MTAKEAAAKLNGCEYGEEGSDELWKEMAAAGLVAVFGASDDLVEIRGAGCGKSCEEEVDAWEGTTVRFTPKGLLKAQCADEDCPHEAKHRESATAIAAIWYREPYSWVFEATIPAEPFEVLEDGEPYCRGLVFALADCGKPA